MLYKVLCEFACDVLGWIHVYSGFGNSSAIWLPWSIVFANLSAVITNVIFWYDKSAMSGQKQPPWYTRTWSSTLTMHGYATFACIFSIVFPGKKGTCNVHKHATRKAVYILYNTVDYHTCIQRQHKNLHNTIICMPLLVTEIPNISTLEAELQQQKTLNLNSITSQ